MRFRKRVRQIRNAAIALLGTLGVVAAIITANTDHAESLSCEEMRTAIRHMPGTRGQHMRALRQACGTRRVRRPDGLDCRDGLLYGQLNGVGIGGTNPDGSPATCAPRPGIDRWRPFDAPDSMSYFRFRPADFPLHSE